MKVIQMVKTSKDNTLFIIGVNKEGNELTFRTSQNPERLQKEKIIIEKDLVYLNLYYFHVNYLKKFLKSNK
jgi:hypothetical protein